uniref:Uncharacterized protein n=1 Tax=Arabidopsis halleri subsp. halleri TaxID=81971 RepID=I0J3C4_ARAHH|nr:predicted protein [Arabidopsis halleri subsp. halleri]
MASNLIPFKGFPTLEMIGKLKYNINTLNSEIETLIVTTHPENLSFPPSLQRKRPRSSR